MMPPAVVPVAAPVWPAALPAPLLAAGVAPRASRSVNHVSGAVEGTLTDYSDLNACAWFQGGGRDLRNRRGLGARGLSGLEDCRHARR